MICDYCKVKASARAYWYWNYRISICINGVNYTSEAVQALIARNLGKISVTITIDGTKQKHDLQRVFPDGSGSYDTIEKGIDLWLSQFRGSTKVTFASDDLPMLKRALFFLVSPKMVFTILLKLQSPFNRPLHTSTLGKTLGFHNYRNHIDQK